MTYYSQVMRTIDSQLPQNVIDLRQRGVWDNDIFYLVGKEVAYITKIQLWDNRFTWKSIKMMSKCKWDNLTSMDVDMNGLRNKGAKYLSRMVSPFLKVLNLSSNDIGKEGVIHITKGYWPNLQIIYFNGNSLGVDSMRHLNKNNWKNMGDLYLCIEPQEIDNTSISFMQGRRLILNDWALLEIELDQNMTRDQQIKLQQMLRPLFERRFQ